MTVTRFVMPRSMERPTFFVIHCNIYDIYKKSKGKYMNNNVLEGIGFLLIAVGICLILITMKYVGCF